METEMREDPATQAAEIFGPLAAKHTNLFLASSGQGLRPPHPPPSHPEERAPKAQRQKGHKGKGRSSPPETPDDLLKALARLALRQEGSLQALRQNTGFVLFLRPGDKSPLPLLLETATEWKAKAEARRMDGRSLEGHPHLDPLQALVEHAAGHGGERREQSAAEVDGLAEGWCVVIPEVGQHLSPVGSGHGQRAGETRTAHAATGEDPPSIPATERHNTIQVHPAPGSAGQEKYTSGLHPGCGSAREGNRRGLEPPAHGPGTGSPTGHRPPGQAGDPEEEPAGRLCGEASLTLACKLSNPSNLCYANAFVLAYAWCVQHANLTPTEAYGEARQAWRDVLYSQGRAITEIPSWRPLLRGWSEVRSQHDTIEFLHHVLSRARVTATAGEWQARYVTDRRPTEAVAWDRGSTAYSIALSVPGLRQGQDFHTVQHLLEMWHQQAHTHALTSPPRILLLTLARYEHTVLGPRKSCDPVLLFPIIQMPTFVDGSIRCTRVQYKLRSIIIHHGHSIRSGHYTSALMDSAGRHWLADDGRAAVSRNELSVHAHRNCYILMFVRL